MVAVGSGIRKASWLTTMSLETTLIDITERLRQNKYPNEQAISQGIVLRVLRTLEWDCDDTTLVWPEYQTGEGRADFALCHPPTKPAVLIEVKKPGKAEEDSVRQALIYAFTTGVTFVVLTDGRTWSFYLPAEQGSYEERRERPDLRDARAALPGGWLVATNISNREKEKIIRFATEVAGLTYGKDVIVEL
jgi:hypothetical protein